MRSILNRLKEVEHRFTKDPLIVLAYTETGILTEMTMQECLNRKADFVKIISGTSLSDFDLYLTEISKQAFLNSDSH